ncbi:MAG: DNA polymerase ligase N-terminal domain-containing protein [Pseudomonadales bacterium]|jgi:DNA ligase D-like protein (predicted 3'-phosphoesterase)|nr:DNA polymerase ligase N-terminal domain-containing protein [Pseudomonadales bacterium]
MNDRLARYRARRDPDRTPEPAGRGRRRSRGGRRFVIQKHDASTLHYDFRLEIDGVLVSWAVPKGPRPDPRVKRLAVRTEDHPLAYADFEGVIPEDEYGGGTVLLWDQGTYRNLRARKGRRSRSMERSLKEGLLEVELHGEKLTGGWALKRFRRGRQEQWLLIKMRDDAADARRNPVSTQPRSVASGRTLAGLARETGR